MRKKLALLGFVIAGAIGLSTVATTLPASAAPTTSLAASSNTLTVQGTVTAVPASTGAVQCSGDLCIQRTTSIINNKATIKAWADTVSFVGHFELLGPDGHLANSPTENWVAGGKGANFKGVARGSGYTIIAWDGNTKLGVVNFSV